MTGATPRVWQVLILDGLLAGRIGPGGRSGREGLDRLEIHVKLGQASVGSHGR